jgi:hypothetical protein
MQSRAVLMARLLGFVELACLNPGGKIFFPDVLAGIGNKFNFQKLPTGVIDESKGVEFGDGRWEGVNVSKLTIYSNGFLVDTQSSSDDSERILLETLDWATREFGISFSPEMIYRRRYLSNVTFASEVPLLDGFAPARRLKENLRAMSPAILEDDIEFAGARLDIDFERYQRNAPISSFTIQRRQNTAFADGRYFSEAPLPTDLHWQFLEEYERDMLNVVR